jgi:phosphatidylserine/phosphatidylglycerophosphate/cardiolipin synthase-like enzyme
MNHLKKYGYFFLIFLTLKVHNVFAERVFSPDACHPKVTQECVLYPFFKDDSTVSVLKYKDIVSYYNQVAKDIIIENKKNVVLKNSKYEVLSNQNREDLSFQVDLAKMVIVPLQDLSPETVQLLFRFNVRKFNSFFNQNSFVHSKVNYFFNKNFNNRKLEYEREFLLFSDWQSLFHPPFFSTSLDSNGLQEKSDEPIFKSESFQKTMDELSGTELTHGNKVSLLVANRSFQEKKKLITSAKNYIWLAVMTFDSTSESLKLADDLITQAEKGVEVFVIMEKVWTQLTSRKLLNKLKNSKVKVALADDFIRIKGEKQGLFHSKFMLVDGNKAISGGQNLVHRSILATGYNHYIKDLDVWVEGPLVTDMMNEFMILWNKFSSHKIGANYQQIITDKYKQENEQSLRGQKHYASWFKQEKVEGVCRFISQGPQKDKYSIGKAYHHIFENMQKYSIFTSQHIDTTIQKAINQHPSKDNHIQKIYRTLVNKAKDGKPVTLITNGIDGGLSQILEQDDQDFAAFISRKFNDFAGYLNAAIRRKSIEYVASQKGISVWQLFQYIHAKVLFVDDEILAVGSYNFESYSSENSYETTIICQDANLLKELKNDLYLNLYNSTPVITKDRLLNQSL